MLESIYEQLPATLEELERPATEHHGLLVVIEGLEKATGEFERTWHISRAHAKLTELFRHLTYLSRKYSDRICIIVENLSGIHRTNIQYDPTAVVKSMFVPESLPATQNFPYMRGVFDCDMDQGVDAQLLVSKYNDSVVCEVTKDRTGDGLGRCQVRVSVVVCHLLSSKGRVTRNPVINPTQGIEQIILRLIDVLPRDAALMQVIFLLHLHPLPVPFAAFLQTNAYQDFIAGS
ncbi:hypothetical protein KEM55_000644 [Ascosphaera atra]|nr:hypothetical protein KEM55_000644 [Ascosphaera atra]